MVDTQKMMNDRKEFERAAIEEGHMLPRGYMSTCDWHIPVEMMQWIKTDEVFCPKCYTENISKLNAEKDSKTQEILFGTKAQRFNYFKQYSVFQNKAVQDNGLNNFEAKEPERKKNKSIAIELVRKIAGGKVINCVITGNSGVGKTHLAAGIANNVNLMSNRHDNQMTVLFFSFSQLLNLIRDSYRNQTFKSEAYYLELAANADLLVLDDLAAEIGSGFDPEKAKFSNKILYQILVSREDKSTIVTSNLNLDSLAKQYDPRVIRRLKDNLVPITFTETEAFEKMPV